MPLEKEKQQDLNTPDTHPAGLEEPNQQPLPEEQGINLDNAGPKLPKFSKLLSSLTQHYKSSLQGNNSILLLSPNYTTLAT